MSTVKNDQQPKTTTRTPPSPPVPTAAEAKAAAAAAKAKAEEGAEDIGNLMPEVKAEPSDRSGLAYRTVMANLTGVLILDGDVSKALTAMEGLSPGETRSTLEGLQKDGVLDKIISESDGDNRSRLVDLLMKAGMVGSTTPAAGVPGPTGPQPPQPPTLAKQEPALSPQMREMLREENVARAKTYKQEFAHYRTEYRAAINEAKDAKELRRLGKIVEPNLPAWEPGTPQTGDDREWPRLAERKPDVDTASLVTNRFFELSGRVPPGTDFALTGTLALGFAHTVEAEAEVEVTRKRNGKTDAEGELTVTGKIGPDAAHLVASGGLDYKNEDGKVTKEAKKAHVGLGYGKEEGISGDAGKDGVRFGGKIGGQGGEVEITKEKFKIEAEGGGAKIGVEKTDDKATLTVGIDGVTLIGGVDKNGGIIMGGELGGEMDVGLVDIEATIGGTATVQLPTRADYDMFFAKIGGDPFTPPPELDRGVRWEKLPVGVQKAYELFGWTAKDWNGAAGDKQKIQSAMIGGR